MQEFTTLPSQGSEVQQLYQYGISLTSRPYWKAVVPLFSNLHLGTNYQLQISTNLSGSFTNYGSAFTSTNPPPLGVISQYFNVADWKPTFLPASSGSVTARNLVFIGECGIAIRRFLLRRPHGIVFK